MKQIGMGRLVLISILSFLFATSLYRVIYYPHATISFYGQVNREMYWQFWVYTELLNVRRFKFTSNGGYAEYADKIADLAHRRQVKITAMDRCISACADIFLAARDRVISPGAIVGFHNSYIGMLTVFKERGVAFTPILEQRVAKEKKYLPVGAQDLLIEAMRKIDVREAFLAPFKERPNEIGEHTRSYFDIWVPGEEDYKRYGIEVTWVKPKISPCEAWRKIAYRPRYRFVYGNKAVGPECASKAS